MKFGNGPLFLNTYIVNTFQYISKIEIACKASFIKKNKAVYRWDGKNKKTICDVPLFVCITVHSVNIFY